MIERAIIHVAGPADAGKTTLIERLLHACPSRSFLAARRVRDDRLRAPKETRPRASTELQRYRQAGASNAILYRFPESHADVDAFYASHLMEDYSEGVLLEGDRPLEWVHTSPAPSTRMTPSHTISIRSWEPCLSVEQLNCPVPLISRDAGWRCRALAWR